MARAISRKSLTALVFLGAFGSIALTALGASALALAMTGPLAMALNQSIHIDTLGGGFGAPTDRIVGPGGGNANAMSFAQCDRRADRKPEQLDPRMGDERASATARRICGA